MSRVRKQLSLALGLALTTIQPSYALDSYRYLHVTIETPWFIFVFLLATIFVPFILMAVLVWRYAERKSAAEEDKNKSEAAE